MSTFVEKLKRVYINAAPPIGFRKPVADELPPMLITADITGASAKKIRDLCSAEVDGFIVNSSSIDSQSFGKLLKNVDKFPMGIRLDSGDLKDLSLYIELGCDFLVFDLKTGTDIISNEKLGKVLKISNTLPPAMVKPINDIGSAVDSVLMENNNKFIVMELLLNLQLFSTLLNKPLQVEVKAKLSAEDLTALNRVGIKGLVLDNSISAEEVKEMRKVVSGLPKTLKNKATLRPLIPGISSSPESKPEEEEGDDEEDI